MQLPRAATVNPSRMDKVTPLLSWDALWEWHQANRWVDWLAFAGVGVGAAFLISRSLRRYAAIHQVTTLAYHCQIPPSVIKEQRPLKGWALLVNDSDNLRFYHRRPLWPFKPRSLAKSDLKANTINVRIAGIDAPEMAHFGSPAQPYAQDAMQWLTKTIQGKSITLIPHRIDQYGRLVASVYWRPLAGWWPWRRNLSLAMVEAGWAVVYEGGGAEWGGIKERLKEAEAKAQRARRGMWKQSPSSFVHPADFKRSERNNQ